MNGVSPVAGTMDVAAGGTSSLAVAVLASTEHVSAKVAAELFRSLGLGSHVDVTA